MYQGSRERRGGRREGRKKRRERERNINVREYENEYDSGPLSSKGERRQSKGDTLVHLQDTASQC